jgi:hypothetical protein
MRINFTEISEPDALAAGQLPLCPLCFCVKVIHPSGAWVGWLARWVRVGESRDQASRRDKQRITQSICFHSQEGVSVSLRVRKLSKQTGTLPKQVFLQSALPSFSLYLLNGSAVLCFAFDVARRAWCHLRIRPGRWKCRGFGFL